MSRCLRKRLGIWAGIVLLAGAIFLARENNPSASPRADTPVSREKLVEYIRDRFGILSAVNLTVGPYRDSVDPKFEEATVMVDDGKQKQNILVSKDGRYLIVGTVRRVTGDPKLEIPRYVREQFKVPDTAQLTAGPYRKSAFLDFYETTVTFDDGKKKQTQNFYVTKESQGLVFGSVFNLRVDPRREAMRAITLDNQPTEGPAKAPVTMVEYADLECPMCAKLHEFLEKDLLPKYGDKVRVVFKEFPLPSHDWSMTAAIASQCTYEINPGAFTTYRSLIFKNQGSINATNARDMLLNLAAQAGIDSLKLAACVDSKASLPRVEQNMREAKQLDVVSTPTSYINGKRVIGSPPPDTFFQLIEEALRPTK